MDSVVLMRALPTVGGVSVVGLQDPEVRVLVEHREQPVLVRQGRLLASTFHPELSNDLRVHRYFLDQVA